MEFQTDYIQSSKINAFRNGNTLFVTGWVAVGDRYMDYPEKSGYMRRQFVPWETISDRDAIKSMLGKNIAVNHPGNITLDNFPEFVANGQILGNFTFPMLDYDRKAVTATFGIVNGSLLKELVKATESDDIDVAMRRLTNMAVGISPQYNVELKPTSDSECIQTRRDYSNGEMSFLFGVPPRGMKSGTFIKINSDSDDGLAIAEVEAMPTPQTIIDLAYPKEKKVMDTTPIQFPGGTINVTSDSVQQATKFAAALEAFVNESETKITVGDVAITVKESDAKAIAPLVDAYKAAVKTLESATGAVQGDGNLIEEITKLNVENSQLRQEVDSMPQKVQDAMTERLTFIQESGAFLLATDGFEEQNLYHGKLEDLKWTVIELCNPNLDMSTITDAGIDTAYQMSLSVVNACMDGGSSVGETLRDAVGKAATSSTSQGDMYKRAAGSEMDKYKHNRENGPRGMMSRDKFIKVGAK